MSAIKFEGFSMQCKKALGAKGAQWLEEAADEIESQAKRNSRVNTGQTKGSFRHQADDTEATVGSDYLNAIWEEFGTGEYALEGGGRKGGWFYKDEKGDGHFTHGKKPRRALWNAYQSLKGRLTSRAEQLFKELN